MDSLWRLVVRAAAPTGDSSFGPTSRIWFDFTITFEEIFFGMLPTAVLIVVAPFFLLGYKQRAAAAAADGHMWAKLALSTIVAALEIVAAVLRTTIADPFATTAAAHTLSCLAAFVMTALLFFDHRYAIQSSAIIGIYFSITMFLDIARARAFFLRGAYGSRAVASIYVAISCLKFAILILTEVPKRYTAITGNDLGKEATSGFWNRTLFIWLNSTLFFGFQNRLLVDDLPNLGPNFHSEKLAATFEPHWIRHEGSSHRLTKASFRSLIWSFLPVVPVRLLHIGFLFTQPFLIQQVLEYFGSDNKSTDTRDALIGAYILSNLGVILSQVWYQHLNYQLVTRARGTLVSHIIRKNLSITHQEAKKAAAATLMSTDIDGLSTGITKLQDTWACFVEIGLATYFLSTIIGKGAFLIIVPAVLSSITSAELGRRFQVAKKAWNDAIEKRVSKTSSILSQIKGIKMMGIELKIANFVQELREVEVAFSKSTRKLNVVVFACTPIAYAFTPIIVIAAGVFWTNFTGDLEATSTFTTLGFTSMAVDPMLTLLTSWPQIGSFLACMGRIENFLLLEERHDSREVYGQDPLADYEDSSNNEVKKKPIDQFPIQFLKASIAPADSQDGIVHVHDTVIKRSTLTMVVGPTGCGKSTLLKAIVGEANVVQGTVYVAEKHLAYCDQDVWIRNITMRDNVIGENVFDELWYNRVVYACMLADVDEFPDGDLTPAGSGGANLSGGQKQRIALGRAIYARPRILVMEDMLSAVDRPSVSVIMERLFGSSGILRRLGTTVVMATHASEHLDRADAILAIDDNGIGKLTVSKPAITTYAETNLLPRDDTAISDGATDDISAARHYQAPAPEPKISTSLRPEGDWPLWSFYLGSMSKTVFVVWLVVTAFGAVLERSPDIFLRIWVEHAPKEKTWFVGYALLGVSCMRGMAVLTWIFLLHLVPESSERLHRQLVDTAMQATYSFLSYTDSGSLLNRFSQDMSLVSQELPIAMLLFVDTIFLGLTYLGIILAGTRYAFAILPFAAVGFFILQFYYLRSSKQMRLLDLEAKTPLYTLLTEMSDGLQHIRAFGWESVYYVKGLVNLDHSQKPFYYMFCIQRWLILVVGLCVVVISATLVSFALTFSVTTQSSLGLSMLIAMKVSTVLADVIEFWVDLETSLGSVSRLASFIGETKPEVANEQDTLAAVPDNWPHRGDIELIDVSSEYTTATGNNAALREVSTTITGGTKVGIVGRTGSGKSSLFVTLMNFLNYTGEITIDGIEISTVPRHVLRSRITTITQDLMNLPSSIRDNVVPGDMDKVPGEARVEDAVVVAALRRVGLSDHILARGGLGASIDDIGLSNGQKQLLALARAIVHNGQTNSKIVLVDEATSGIDVECEEKMQAVMSDVFESCTVLTIAHRLQTMNTSDVLLEMSEGNLVHDE